ncbi:MAG: hypothetical protein PHW04_13975 [Candidatus Wallbacteria bacterium]|nr:hypothetical protein [Candidatus Wallbacteria bacterium]
MDRIRKNLLKIQENIDIAFFEAIASENENIPEKKSFRLAQVARNLKDSLIIFNEIVSKETNRLKH